RRLPREFQDAIARAIEIARQAGADPTTCARVLRACERRRPGPAPAAPDPCDGRPRRKGRPRRGRVWRLILPPEVERQPGAPTVIVACTLTVCRGPAWMAEHLAAHGYCPRPDSAALTAPGRPTLFPSYLQVDDADAVGRPEAGRSRCRAIRPRTA